jgi:RHS repeat-associated protein
VALVDESGNFVGCYEYDAWGNVVSHSGLDAYFTFSSKHYDENAGLYYYGYRWYDPVAKRWTQPDPSGLSEGLDLYRFCGNDPINNVDVYGMFWYDVTAQWWQSQVSQSKDILLNSRMNQLPGGWLAVGTANAVMDFGLGFMTLPQSAGQTFEGLMKWSECPSVENWIAAMPQALVNLGEGLGTWCYDPTWENFAGAAADISVASSVLAAGMSSLEIGRAPIGYKGGEITFTRPSTGTVDLRIGLGHWNSGPWYRRFPHYHRRIIDLRTGQTVSGGAIKYHRPWERGL